EVDAPVVPCERQGVDAARIADELVGDALAAQRAHGMHERFGDGGHILGGDARARAPAIGAPHPNKVPPTLHAFGATRKTRSRWTPPPTRISRSRRTRACSAGCWATCCARRRARPDSSASSGSGRPPS